ncbi:MAG: hypothetical protein A2043_10005 [Candidatus Schekmanbacteria bacterium GWA2_38_9]|uniref:Septum formation initiator n=1 Tax=Candidatus Schekmanbacteria bacterium RIFCSPLOWO2_12_FULL_38_15 TaxID=1817883 RepID=A0A1F7SG25_9BACT|nr:MAG: hypothetical protein A2043_10005 [Candidatus Schekmanbacteria bacterium GWA2_38_9]OGL49551.1 MAG: hypothetical protein A3H37_02455 [Candidatus Schekmanbacteria bacterium RIFCSPLOWO2_02_FULL_38_14]OGL52740.1 MAG: hypothetical protein A3G31_03725 [Candidatus Schekmanbacteria bacterium RIFCSPLOWO2_12_FULL_38_15]
MIKKVKKINNSLGSGRFKLTIYLVVFYFVFLALNFVFGDKGYFRMKELNTKKEELIAEMEKVSQENEQLSNELIAAKNSQFWIEKVAREELDMVKDGEIVFKFYEKEGGR